MLAMRSHSRTPRAGTAPPESVAVVPVERVDASPAVAAIPVVDPRISAEEYARWLLPPEPRDATERTVHALSVAAGAISLAGGLGLLWWVL